jgi:hypothetical protein
MEYRWQSEPKGMYSDRHERDVVHYQENIFLLRWAAYDRCTRKWAKKGGDAAEPSEAATGGDVSQKKSKRQVEEEKWEEEPQRSFVGTPDGKVIVIWQRDECICYANDCWKICWVHSSETVKWCA